MLCVFRGGVLSPGLFRGVLWGCCPSYKRFETFSLKNSHHRLNIRSLQQKGVHILLSTLRIAFVSTILFAVLPSSSSFAEHLRFQETSEAGVSYELVIESETPEVMKPLPVKINVSNPKGTPITGAQISCSLTMPAMAMPTNKPPIKESAKSGQYKGVFLLTMGGLWQVKLATSYGDGKQDTVVISIPGVMSEGNTNDVDSKLESLFHEEKNSNK